MEFFGRIVSLTKDYKTQEWNITIATKSNYVVKIVEKLVKVTWLSIEIKKKRKKRSLDANAYCWVLLQKLAEATNSDRWSVYLEMLKRYSRAFTFIVVKEDAVERTKEQWRECIDLGEVDINGQKGHQLQVFFGSSTFDSKEMSVFIDGIVSECKELGIETIPPEELERMKEQWNL